MCCADCGPRLHLFDACGRWIDDDPLQTTVAALQAGKIVAIKALGGFHLACDARNESAVRELRQRKHRDEKPLAVMARDVAAVSAFCHLTDEERALLQSRARPIVLLRRRVDDDLAVSVAPGNRVFAVFRGYAHLAGMPPAVSTLNYAAGFLLASARVIAAGAAIAHALKSLGRPQWLRA